MPSIVNKGNSSIPLFKSHKWIERKQIRVTTKTQGNISTIRGNQRTTKTLKSNKKQTTIQHT